MGVIHVAQDVGSLVALAPCRVTLYAYCSLYAVYACSMHNLTVLVCKSVYITVRCYVWVRFNTTSLCGSVYQLAHRTTGQQDTKKNPAD